MNHEFFTETINFVLLYYNKKGLSRRSTKHYQPGLATSGLDRGYLQGHGS